jgi:hypothetical protein
LQKFCKNVAPGFPWYDINRHAEVKQEIKKYFSGFFFTFFGMSEKYSDQIERFAFAVRNEN